MPRLLRLPVPTADQDISLEQTVASSDGRPSPPARSRAQIAFDETRVGETGPGSPSDDGASSGGHVDRDSELALGDTHRSEEPRPIAPVKLVDPDQQRAKALLKGKLFRTKAAPVKLGRFTVLDHLGEGGMGVVYTAYDDRLDRKVALKVLRSGEATRGDTLGRARLQREAQAMARLSHPNIVAVHEVDTTPDGQLYVAMEFVRGLNLDAWLKHHERPWREVLDVFLQAGRGLQAAHAAGIIHRDFKPHNVLVGDDGVVKVLDFGLARAAELAGDELPGNLPALPEARGLLASPLTQTGAIMGTPAYMAPEQHEGRPASAASDQFAFCVSLYEGLYGRHPFSTSTLAALIGDVLAGNVAPVPKDTRVPARLLRALRRGLAVEEAQRWPTMADLLAELARDPESRRRRTLATAALAGVVGFAGFGAAALQQPAAAPVCAATEELGWDAARGEAVRSAILGTQLAYAGETWTKIGPQLDAYAQQWSAMRAEACETHASGHQSDQLFDLRTACLDQRRAGFHGLVDALASADAEVVQKAALAVGALPSLARCADVAALTADVPPPEDPRTATRVQGLRETLARAKAQEDAGRYTAGLATVEPVLAEAESIGYPPLVAEAALRRGSMQMEAEQLAEADASLERALWTAVTAGHDDIAAQAAAKRLFLRANRLGRVADATREIPLAQSLNDREHISVDTRAEFLNNLGAVYLAASDHDRARASMLAALELHAAHGRGGSVADAITLGNLGYVVMFTGHEAEAQDYLRRALALSRKLLGEAHPHHQQQLVTLARSLYKQGKFPEAARLLAPFADGSTPTGALIRQMALATLGNIAFEERDYEAAARRFDAVLAQAERQGLAPGELQEAAFGLADSRAALGDLPYARAVFADRLKQATDQFGENHPEAVYVEYRLAETLARSRSLAEAQDHYEQAKRRCENIDATAEVLCADIELGLGRVHHRLGDLAAAEQALLAAIAIYERVQSGESRLVAEASTALALVELDLRRFDAATTRLRRAVAIDTDSVDPDSKYLAEARLALARALTGDAAVAPDEALALARQARDVYAARSEPFAAEARAANEWLAAHGG